MSVQDEVVQHSMENLGLEMILRKGRIASLFSSDYSTKEIGKLIDQAYHDLDKAWGTYHPEELKLNKVGGLPYTEEVKGNMGFYARIEHLPPTEASRARIRVAIPLNPKRDGLENPDTTELKTIRDSLQSRGYRLLANFNDSHSTWLPPQA